jgi:hypothetical protein
MNHEEHGIPTIGTSDRHPLLNAADPDLLQPLDAVRR